MAKQNSGKKNTSQSESIKGKKRKPKKSIEEQKKETRESIKQRVREAIYELQLDTIIDRENIANELFGSVDDVKKLNKVMEKTINEKNKVNGIIRTDIGTDTKIVLNFRERIDN